jgi:tetratricopeptide (TPR) repeat protein
MTFETKSEVEKELSEIRREVIESRNLVIKTDNLLKSLHAELKMFGKKQDDVEKHLWVSSGVSYLVFTTLLVAASILLLVSRSGAARREREHLEKSVSEMRAHLDKLQADADATKVASRVAADAYRQLNTGNGDDRLKAIEQLAKVNQARLSPLERQALNDRAEQVRTEVGQITLDRGKAAFRKRDMRSAIAELTRFSTLNPAKPEMLEASYFLGAAYNQTRQHQQAVPLLARFVAEEKRSKVRDHAMLLLAQSYEQTGQLEKALEVARQALATYPNSEFAPQFRSRLGAVKRVLAANAGDAPSAPKPPKPPESANAADAASLPQQ